jgi:50S ribosomal protein L16 3-hydroxylase
MNPGLQSLLNTTDTSSFVKSCYPNDLFITKGPFERLTELCNYTFDEIVAMPKAFVRVSFWTLASEGSVQAQMTVPNAEARKCFDAGMTVYFHEIKWPRIDVWLREVEKELSLVPNSSSVSAFAAHRGKGLPYHWDENSNFICQSRGKKRWRIVPNRIIKNPSVGHIIHHEVSERLRAEANGKEIPRVIPDSEVIETVTMEPGMVMFMPKGMWHDTETVDDVSIHFNIQTRWPKWSDALRMLVDETPAVYAEELFREEVPTGLTEEMFVERLQGHLEILARSPRKDFYKKLYEKFHR